MAEPSKKYDYYQSKVTGKCYDYDEYINVENKDHSQFKQFDKKPLPSDEYPYIIVAKPNWRKNVIKFN